MAFNISSINPSAVFQVIECFEEYGETGKQLDGSETFQQVPPKTLQRPLRLTGPVMTPNCSFQGDRASMDDEALTRMDTFSPDDGTWSPMKRQYDGRTSAELPNPDGKSGRHTEQGVPKIEPSLVSTGSSQTTLCELSALQPPTKAYMPSSFHDFGGSVGVVSGEILIDTQIKNTPRKGRSLSLTIIQSFEISTTVQADRRSSLPDVSQVREHHARGIFQQTNPLRDIFVPFGPTSVEPEARSAPRGTDDLEWTQVTVSNEKHEGPDNSGDGDATEVQTTKPNALQRFATSVEKTYYPSEAPPLIMPSGPTDTEKTMYLRTNRIGLYSFGVFSFLSLSAGMWIFVVSSPIFYWFGAVVALLQIYLVISYGVSIMGKDYDYKEHLKILEDHPIDPETCPTVDIYLPCCKEPIEILENTYKHVQELKWPEGKLKVYVLDDGASDQVHALATRYGFNYICRDDRPRLKKAGNLRWAFARTSGDFFNIYDADFCPRPDFLYEIMPIHIAKPDTAIVQSPQFFRTMTEQSWVEQGAGAVQELFYRVVQINRNRWGASICVGSNAVYRREALVDVGGTAEIGFSEDVHTGFYAVTRGWKVRYLPLCLACGICPDTPRAFFSQQMRWCMGSTTLLTNMDFWRSNLGLIQKVCYLSGMMYYTAISLSIFINPMPGILMIWFRPDYVRFYNLAYALPSIFYSVIAVRAWSKASFGFNAQFVMVIQSYAYLTAIKDRLFGRALAWVPSGDTKAHKNNKYRNMRILACCWMTTVVALVVSGSVYQILRGLAWYDCFPLLLLDAFNVFLAHRFMLWNGKI